MDKREEKHDWLVNQIFLNPKLIGVTRPILLKNKELVLMHNQEYLTVPDIYFLTQYQQVYVEVKSSHSPMLYDKGMKQLEKIIFWCNQYEKPIPDARLIMPNHNKKNREMVKELNYYRFGDQYELPYITYTNY